MDLSSILDLDKQWSRVTLDSAKRDELRKFFATSVKKMPVDVLVLRQGMNSVKRRLRGTVLSKQLQRDILIILVVVNLLVMLALVIYFSCSRRTEPTSELPACTCAIEATQETVNRKLKVKSRGRDFGFVRYTNAGARH